MPRVSPRPNNPRRISELGALRIVDPNKWAAKVKRALKDSGGFIDPAAEALDVSRRTLLRWLAEERDGLLKGATVAATGKHRDGDA